MAARDDPLTRWAPRPFQAALLRCLAFLTPFAASIAFLHLAGRLVPPPAGPLWAVVGWWLLMTAAATGVLVVVERLCRRALPLAALYKLSLVFPDRAPSRFRVALRSGDVATLEERVERARQGLARATPVEAAQRLLELVAALDVHDSLTRGHSERVRAYAQMIGAELGLSKRELDLLNWSALLHDVGKLGVPTEILTKPGRPSEEEWRELRRHPELGEELVRPLQLWLGEWAAAVRDHHERWDGAGYPAGKAGDEIALAGRIVAVADVFDVITSARSYKTAAAAVEGRAEIARCAGSQFDPRVVRAFLGVSLGRLRFAMGPLSWLAHAPVLGRFVLSPGLGTVTGSLAVATTAVGAGLVGAPPDRPAAPEPTRAAAAAAPAPGPQSPPAARPAPGVAAAPAARTAYLIRRSPAPAAEAAPATQSDPVLPAAAPAAEAPPPTVVAEPTSPEPAPSPQPAATPPAAPSVELEIDEDQAARIRLAGVTGSGSVSALSVVAPPATGTATATGAQELLYEPPPDFNGSAGFGYEACWGEQGCARGRVGIRVRPVNDPPRAVADEAAARAGDWAEVAVLANDTDVDGDTLTVTAVEAGEGRAETDGRTVRFLPAASFRGVATLRYTVADGAGGEAVGSVAVTVAPVNRAPEPRADAATVAENGSVVVDVLANDSDPDGDALVVAAVGSPTAGAVSAGGRTVEYTPPPGLNGEASFTYVAADPSGATASALVTVTVTAVNSPPTFELAGDQAVAEDSGPLSVTGFATAISPGPADEAGQAVSFLVSTTKPSLFAAGGQPAIAQDGTLAFTPAPDANGTATVTVKAVDDGGTAGGGRDKSDPRTFTITVVPVNDAPVAVADTVHLDEDQPGGATFSVCANDADVDGDSLTFVSFDPSGVTRGTLTDLGDGDFAYVPEAGWSGTETFTYTVTDGKGGDDTETVTIVVAPQPDDPEAAGDAYVVVQDGVLSEAAPGLLANDGDEDRDALVVETTPVSGVTSGTLVLGVDGSFTYTPAAGFTGNDTFTYRVQDGTGRSAIGSVTITVSPSIASSTFFLQPSGPSADVWSLSTSPPPAAAVVPDHDGDLFPGLTIEKSGGKENEADPDKWQEWVYDVPAPLVLNGPVRLQLWSTLELFAFDKAGHPHVYLYDCAAGGACTKIAETDVHVNRWNALLPTWVFNEITLGSVTRTIPAGRELRVRLLFDHEDLWLALTQAYPSALVVTLG